MLYLLLFLPLLPIIWLGLYAVGIIDVLFHPVAFIVMGITSLATLAIYLRSVLKNPALSREGKFMFCAGMIAFSIPTQVYYWFVHRKQLL